MILIMKFFDNFEVDFVYLGVSWESVYMCEAKETEATQYVLTY